LQSDEEHILREALLAAGTDPEAPVDSSRKRKRSWYSLLGTAVAYVWPDSVFLQLRAFACVILILIMRVLNLAVPILYKKVVDTLASTSEGTHPRPGDEKEHYQFWQVNPHHACLPSQWTLDYNLLKVVDIQLAQICRVAVLQEQVVCVASHRVHTHLVDLNPWQQALCVHSVVCHACTKTFMLRRLQLVCSRADMLRALQDRQTELIPTCSVLNTIPIVCRSSTPLCSST